MADFYFIDASPYIFRAYFSLPSNITSPAGRQVNAVYGFTDFIIQILKKAMPDYIALAFDGSLTTSFRNDIYPEYKAQRALPPPELEAQIGLCMEVGEAMGMETLIDDSYEADDLIATLIAEFADQEGRFVVVSSDKDLAQLVDSRTELWDFARDRRFDEDQVREQFGVAPQQIVDLLALMGDSVDNIPGVTGVGRKSAVTLLEHFSSVEEIYRKLDAVADLPIRGAVSLKDKLQHGKDNAFLSKRLATLYNKAPLDWCPQELRYTGVNPDLIGPLFTTLGFDRIRERIPGWSAKLNT